MVMDEGRSLRKRNGHVGTFDELLFGACISFSLRCL